MYPTENHIPIVSIVGSSGAGKTTLMEKIIPQLKSRGLRVATIKHHMHDFQMDRPGKDTWRHKKAGSVATIISSPNQIGLVMDVDHDYSATELAYLASNADIILTEGYKKGNNPKLEVFRSEVHKELLCKNDDHLVALITDEPLRNDLPCFSFSDAERIADFLIRLCKAVPADAPGLREATR